MDEENALFLRVSNICPLVQRAMKALSTSTHQGYRRKDYVIPKM